MDLERSWDEPDETVEFGGVTEQLISIGGLTVARSVQPPGCDRRERFQPLVGGERCQARHVGVTLEGRRGIRHEGWTIGDEPCVMFGWPGTLA